MAPLFRRPGGVLLLVCAAGFYAVIYQLIIGQPLEELGFGVIHVQRTYPAVPSAILEPMSEVGAYDLFAAAVVKVASMTHYYLDSFIWKISDANSSQMWICSRRPENTLSVGCPTASTSRICRTITFDFWWIRTHRGGKSTPPTATGVGSFHFRQGPIRGAETGLVIGS